MQQNDKAQWDEFGSNRWSISNALDSTMRKLRTENNGDVIAAHIFDKNDPQINIVSVTKDVGGFAGACADAVAARLEKEGYRRASDFSGQVDIGRELWFKTFDAHDVSKFKASDYVFKAQNELRKHISLRSIKTAFQPPRASALEFSVFEGMKPEDAIVRTLAERDNKLATAVFTADFDKVFGEMDEDRKNLGRPPMEDDEKKKIKEQFRDFLAKEGGTEIFQGAGGGGVIRFEMISDTEKLFLTTDSVKQAFERITGRARLRRERDDSVYEAVSSGGIRYFCQTNDIPGTENACARFDFSEVPEKSVVSMLNSRGFVQSAYEPGLWTRVCKKQEKLGLGHDVSKIREAADRSGAKFVSKGLYKQFSDEMNAAQTKQSPVSEELAHLERRFCVSGEYIDFSHSDASEMFRRELGAAGFVPAGGNRWRCDNISDGMMAALRKTLSEKMPEVSAQEMEDLRKNIIRATAAHAAGDLENAKIILPPDNGEPETAVFKKMISVSTKKTAGKTLASVELPTGASGFAKQCADACETLLSEAGFSAEEEHGKRVWRKELSHAEKKNVFAMGGALYKIGAIREELCRFAETRELKKIMAIETENRLMTFQTRNPFAIAGYQQDMPVVEHSVIGCSKEFFARTHGEALNAENALKIQKDFFAKKGFIPTGIQKDNIRNTGAEIHFVEGFGPPGRARDLFLTALEETRGAIESGLVPGKSKSAGEDVSCLKENFDSAVKFSHTAVTHGGTCTSVMNFSAAPEGFEKDLAEAGFKKTPTKNCFIRQVASSDDFSSVKNLKNKLLREMVEVSPADMKKILAGEKTDLRTNARGSGLSR